jgi:hypothetical protein
MDVSLANNITSVTNGPTIAIQPFGKADPLTIQLEVAAAGTSGAQSISFNIEGSATGLGSWTNIQTYTVDGTYTSKGQYFNQVVRYPYLRCNVTAVSGTGASLSVNATVN